MTTSTFFDGVTPVILTFNEARNIDRVLGKLSWAREIVIVDSGSTDATHNILRKFRQVRCIHRAFDSHAEQWQFAITRTGIETEWVLALDADYVLTDDLVTEMRQLTPPSQVSGYRTAFRYCVFGRELSGALYPPVITLYRRRMGKYVQEGHTQRLHLQGDVDELRSPILHDDRKSLGQWVSSQARYAELEAELILKSPWNKLRPQDQLRRLIVVTPWLVPIYCLLFKRGILDGWAGLHYALQRAVAEAVLSLRLVEMHLAQRERNN